jgi:hypothetical protein
VHNAVFVGVVQSISDFGAQLRRFTAREPLARKPITQRYTMDKIADDINRVPRRAPPRGRS